MTCSLHFTTSSRTVLKKVKFLSCKQTKETSKRFPTGSTCGPYLWVQGQLRHVVRVHYGRVGVKDELTPGALGSCISHRYEQVHNLWEQGKEGEGMGRRGGAGGGAGGAGRRDLYMVSGNLLTLASVAIASAASAITPRVWKAKTQSSLVQTHGCVRQRDRQ